MAWSQGWGLRQRNWFLPLNAHELLGGQPFTPPARPCNSLLSWALQLLPSCAERRLPHTALRAGVSRGSILKARRPWCIRAAPGWCHPRSLSSLGPCHQSHMKTVTGAPSVPNPGAQKDFRWNVGLAEAGSPASVQGCYSMRKGFSSSMLGGHSPQGSLSFTTSIALTLSFSVNSECYRAQSGCGLHG